jgi:hypothetical protein
LIATAGVIDGAVLYERGMMRAASSTPRFGFQLYSIPGAIAKLSLAP